MAQLALVGFAAAVALYLLAIVALIAAGRRSDARALAGFVPDCAALFVSIVRDPIVPRWRKLMLVPLVAYLAMPIDLVPDFIPVAGQLDDALVVAVGLRWILGSVDRARLERYWRGPQSSFDVVARLAGVSPPPTFICN